MELQVTPEEAETLRGWLEGDEPQSPFVEGTNVQWAWDSTSLGYLKQCPQLYKYIMIDGWRGDDESVHLRYGQELHTALQQYQIERAGNVPHDDAVHDVIHELLHRTWGWNPDPETKAGKYKNRHTLIRAVVDYLDRHEDDPAKTYIRADGTAAVELSFRFELDFGPRASPGVPYMLCGHLDRVVDFNDALFVMDYKTTTTTPGSYYFDQYHPNNQMSLYTLASSVILEAPVKGVIIEAIQLLVDETRNVRGVTYRTKDQINEWVEDLSHWLGIAEYYAENNYWPKNDTACDKYGGCRFRDICSKDAHVREAFLKSQFKKGEAWNPLKSR